MNIEEAQKTTTVLKHSKLDRHVEQTSYYMYVSIVNYSQAKQVGTVDIEGCYSFKIIGWHGKQST